MQKMLGKKEGATHSSLTVRVISYEEEAHSVVETTPDVLWDMIKMLAQV